MSQHCLDRSTATSRIGRARAPPQALNSLWCIVSCVGRGVSRRWPRPPARPSHGPSTRRHAPHLVRVHWQRRGGRLGILPQAMQAALLLGSSSARRRAARRGWTACGMLAPGLASSCGPSVWQPACSGPSAPGSASSTGMGGAWTAVRVNRRAGVQMNSPTARAAAIGSGTGSLSSCGARRRQRNRTGA